MHSGWRERFAGTINGNPQKRGEERKTFERIQSEGNEARYHQAGEIQAAASLVTQDPLLTWPDSPRCVRNEDEAMEGICHEEESQGVSPKVGDVA